MKKILTIVPVLAIAFAFSASLALAYDRSGSRHGNPSTTVLNTSEALTLNNVSSTSSTGGNAITNAHVSTRSYGHERGRTASIASIFSGDATSVAWSETTANISAVEVAAPTTGATSAMNISSAITENNLRSRAKTGHNHIDGSGNATIGSGSAMSQASALTFVNSSVVKVTN